MMVWRVIGNCCKCRSLSSKSTPLGAESRTAPGIFIIIEGNLNFVITFRTMSGTKERLIFLRARTTKATSTSCSSLIFSIKRPIATKIPHALTPSLKFIYN
jgi:hypothetical protein